MASKGQVQAYLNALPPDLKKILMPLFDYVLSWWALGGDTKAENFAWYRVVGTTSSNANVEFSVAHGMDHPPQTLIPVLDLTAVGSAVVQLQVMRTPDANRIYLRSGSTNAVFTCYLE